MHSHNVFKFITFSSSRYSYYRFSLLQCYYTQSSLQTNNWECTKEFSLSFPPRRSADGSLDPTRPITPNYDHQISISAAFYAVLTALCKTNYRKILTLLSYIIETNTYVSRTDYIVLRNYFEMMLAVVLFAQ